MPVPKLIPLSLIDEPEVAMRSEMNPDKLKELAESIAANGLMSAIGVRRVNERYQIIFGHRRFVAHQNLGRDEIMATDYTGDPRDPEALKFAENFDREDISDADMAIYLSDIQQKYHYDLATLQRITRKSEDWICKRLALFDGDKAVFDALAAGKIKFVHAGILNRFPEQFRQQYLDMVINSTPPGRIVEQWLRELVAMNLPAAPVEAIADATGDPAPLPGVVVDACALCDSNAMPWTMQFKKVHEHCFKAITDAVEAASKG